MKKFTAIEGLRAWLAWAVVADHLAYWSDFHGQIGNILRNLGHPAVMTFCIISGFVLTHLILTKPEPYSVYITRRFFRLFPLFAVTCIAGHFAYQLQLQLPDRSFDPAFMAQVRQIADDTDQHFWAHVAAHASMLYGALPHSWLPSTDVAFNMPAWSISLEWQFYLVAPLIIWILVRRPQTAPVLAGLFAFAQMAVHWGWFGSYVQPAFLLAVGEFFAIGIASRLLFPVFEGRIKQQYIPFALCIVLYTLTRQEAALAIWAVIYMGLIAPPSQLYRLAVESRVAIYLGSRSYSTYLVHFVVLVACQHVATRLSGSAPGFLTLELMVVPTTVLLSELLYRYVELPGIKIGAKLCKQLS